MDEWSKEERDRVVAVFEWLLKEDIKQNPENYIDETNGEQILENNINNGIINNI